MTEEVEKKPEEFDAQKHRKEVVEKMKAEKATEKKE